MEKSGTPLSRKALLAKMAKGLLLYALAPVLLLILLVRPVGEAVRRSDAAAFLIMLAALATLVLNWVVYTLIRRKRPSLLVFAFGILCLVAVVLIEQEALPGSGTLAPTLAIICGFLALLSMLLFSFWLAAHNTRVTRVFAVGLRIIVGICLFFMAAQILRDIEIRHVTRDTWITGAILVIIILVRLSPRIIAAVRRSVLARRATGTTSGRIRQIVGETQFDLDGDAGTVYLVHVQYTVGGIAYELSADIAPQTIRRFGRDAFIGLEVPVWYDPANPANAYTTRIDKQLLEQPQE